MSSRVKYIGLAILVAPLAVGAGLWLLLDRSLPGEAVTVQRTPRIRPDYAGTVIPPNIAPLNFAIEEPGRAYRVRLHAAQGPDIEIASRHSSIVIPRDQWRALLAQNRGGRLEIDIAVQGADRRWDRFQALQNSIAQEEIDSHLVYRLLGAIFVNWKHLGIYQRNLENYDESPILRNTSLGEGCLNCHSFPANRPDQFSLHVRPSSRSEFVGGMVLVNGGQERRLVTRSATLPTLPTYTSWHPTAPLAAVVLSHMKQFMHGAGTEVREVYDLESELAIIHVKTGAVSSSRGIADPDRMETFPAWSPDGKYLYFCSAPRRGETPTALPFAGYETVQYDLRRIHYEVQTDVWGQPEEVLTAAETGQSISEPRISPDGRFLLFCMSHHGAFPVLAADSDLYLLELSKTGKDAFRPLKNANSPEADSWHCWSSNSRWIVFSSKRGNGLFARPHFCYIDREGNDHKPFVLPQQNALFYDTYLKTYNVPELVRGPVTATEEELAQLIQSSVNSRERESVPTPEMTSGLVGQAKRDAEGR
ncbi:MAG: hypothetical protein NTY19_19365 [Planctomycetota bacterium]|nr:hypothetical protein [Planctomycetota bacterium]